MKSTQNLANHPKSLPLLADEIVEFHAARILLLIRNCGRKNSISGLTKMAKLDFFVRYPKFYAVACRTLEVEFDENEQTIESHMIRYHYGPWDQRYYQVLAFLEARELIKVENNKGTYSLSLTSSGSKLAETIGRDDRFTQLVTYMQHVNQVLGGKSGSQLKNLVYELFSEEVTRLPLETVIQ